MPIYVVINVRKKFQQPHLWLLFIIFYMVPWLGLA